MIIPSIGTVARSFARSVRQRGLLDTARIAFMRMGFGDRRSQYFFRHVIYRVNIIRHPIDTLQRKRIRSIVVNAPAPFRIVRGEDSLVIPSGSIESIDRMTRHCQEIFSEQRDSIVAAATPPFTIVQRYEQRDGQTMLLDPERMRPLIDAVCSPELVGIATRYLGQIPAIGFVQLTYTPVNVEINNSQKFHRDMTIADELALMVLIHDTDTTAGPFTWIPGLYSRQAAKQLRHYGGRVSDEQIEQCVPRGAIRQLVGPAGTAAFCNTFRCFHQGGRSRIAPRVMLMVRYNTQAAPLLYANAFSRLANRHLFHDGSVVRRKLLCL